MTKAYNENDGYVGFWIKDTPYEVSRAIEITPETGIRVYLGYKEDVQNDLRKKCGGYVPNYFGGSKDVLNEVYMNGRRYYEFPMWERKPGPAKSLNLKDVVIPKINLSVAVCKALAHYNNIDIELASLICSQFGGDINKEKSKDKWPDLFGILTEEKCDVTTALKELSLERSRNEICPKACTTIGYKIAKSLIKIAALRIFADPEQSIIELPVNSMDSYVPEMKVGKFGMGFFSFLYWLIDHPLRKLYIYSWFRNDDGNVCGYVATLKDIPKKGLVLNLQILETSVEQTGTLIYLDTQHDNFDRATLDKFEKQLAKLQRTSAVRMQYKNGEDISAGMKDTFLVMNGSNKKKNDASSNEKKAVYLGITTTRIFVEDYAKGIPIDVLLGSLFVPSISTKTLKGSVLAPLLSGWVPRNSIKSISQGGTAQVFIILVSNVAVVTLPIEGIGEVVIDMPPWTRLPVSRDDVILSSDTIPIFASNVKAIAEMGILSYRDVIHLQRGLKAYYNYTSNAVNKQAINSALSTISNDYSQRLVIRRVYDDIKVIDSKAVLSDSMNIADVENRLITEFTKILIEGVWYGKRIVPTDNAYPPINTFGMSSLIFVTKTYMKTTGWQKNGAQAYPALNLAPINSDYGKDKERRYRNMLPEKLIESNDKFYTELYISVLSVYDGLNVYFSYPDINGSHLANFKPTYDSILRSFSLTEWRDISYALLEKLSSFKGNQTYGGSQYVWSFVNSSIYIENIPITNTKKLNAFRVQSCITTMNSIIERDKTSFSISNCLFPDKIYAEINNFIRGFGKTNEIMNVMIDSSNSLVEFATMSIILLRVLSKMQNQFLGDPGINRINILTDIKQNHIPELLTYIQGMLKKIRDFKLSAQDLLNIYASVSVRICPQDMTSTFTFIGKFEDEFMEWAKLVTQKSTTFPYVFSKNMKDAIEFKTSQLINYLFTHETGTITSQNILKIFSEASKTSSEEGIKLQITEIAINEGTTKDFISASLTELVQNSVDAIRSTDAKNKSIDIYYGSGEDNESYNLMVRDYVGIPPTAFLYIGIPFLSTKTPSEIVTGEMGSGFFNVYRESSLVIIDTVYDKVSYISYDTPIEENGRVVDISRKVYIIPNVVVPNGTSIVIKSKTNLSKMQISESLGIARYTSEKVLSQVVLFENLQMAINEHSHKIEKKYMFGIGYFDVYFTETTTGSSYPSYLFTKGIPFTPLSNFYSDFSANVRQDMEYGVIINIRHGGYTPVQTRTRLNMPDEAKKEFEYILQYIAFVKAMWLLNNSQRLRLIDNYHWLYPNIDSVASPDQLYKNALPANHYSNYKTSGLNLWFGYINFDLLQTLKYSATDTITDLTNKVIGILLKFTLQAEKEKTRDGWTNQLYKQFDAEIAKFDLSPFPEVQSLGKDTLSMWAFVKNIKAKEIISTIPISKGVKQKPKAKPKAPLKGKRGKIHIPLEDEESEEDIPETPKVKPDKPDILLDPYIRVWLETFISIAVKSNITGWDKNTVSKIYVVQSEEMQQATGYYRSAEKSITINTIRFSDLQRKEIIKNIKAITSPFDFQRIPDVMWQMYFPFKYPATTCPHELEHARRHQGHGSDSHDSTRQSLWKDDIPHERTFDQSANDVFSKVISEGFYDELLKRFKEMK